jgi:surfactin synthase thioesterase subunit
MSEVRGFFIPYAGGSSLAFYPWKRFFSPGISLRFVELAGRGGRMDEAFSRGIDEMAEGVADEIARRRGDGRYFIYGHSMGALLAFEAYYKLVERGVERPCHMFFSGKTPPHLRSRSRYDADCSDAEFLELVLSYGGMPEEVRENIDALKLFLPVLRADFNALHEYAYSPKPEKIQCGVSVLYGGGDHSRNPPQMFASEVSSL